MVGEFEGEVLAKGFVGRRGMADYICEVVSEEVAGSMSRSRAMLLKK